MRKSSLITSIYAIFVRARVNLVGQLFGSELIALLFFPYLKINKIVREYPILVKITLGYILLLCSLIFSDILINGTSFDNYVRGWANIFFSLFTIVFLVYYLGKHNNNIYYYLLLAAISFFIFGAEIEDPLAQAGRTDTFKIYYMVGVNSIVLFLGLYLNKINKKYPILLFGIYAIVCLFLDSRSNGAIFFISALFLFVKNFNIKLSKIKVLIIGAVLLVVLSFSYIYYINSILDGTLKGNNSQQIKELDNPYNPLLLLKVGRTEFFVAAEAIGDNPIWGYGSWAEDKTGKYARAYMSLKESNHMYSKNLIPSHSIILTAWLWAGLGGFLSILFIYAIIIRRALFVFRRSHSGVIVILTPLFLELVWNFLFSPFGHLRETVPFVFALIIIEYYKIKNKTKTIVE